MSHLGFSSMVSEEGPMLDVDKSSMSRACGSEVTRYVPCR